MLLWSVLWHFGLLGLFALSAYGIGDRLLRSLRFHSAAESAAFAIATGLGVLGHLILGLGLLGLLSRMGVALLLAGGLLLGHPRWSAWRQLFARRRGPAAEAPRSRGRLVLGVVAIAAVSAPLWLMPFYPPVDFDATLYHLQLAKTYGELHRVQPLPTVRFSVFPQLNEMLFTAAMLLGDEISAQLMQFLMLLVMALALTAWGARHFTRRAGRWAALLWLGSPLAYWLGVCAYIDMGLSLYCALTTYAFLTWRSTGERGWLGLAGALAGFAASSKYLGLVFVAGFGLWTIACALRERRLGPVWWYTLPGFVTAVPWYLYNIVHTGNPVFPFLGQLFGYTYWSPEDLKYQLWEMRLHGTGKTLGSLLALPVNLSFRPGLFHAEEPLSPWQFLALPVLAYGLLGNRRIRTLVAVIAAYTVFWFSSMQIVRYLSPVFPMLSLASLAAVEELAARRPRWGRFLAHRVTRWVLPALLLVPAWGLGVFYWTARGLPAATPQARDAFLSKEKPLYPAYKFLNDTRGKNYRVYALHAEEMPYYAKGVTIGDWFGFGRYFRFFDKLADSRALYDELRALGADHFLFARYRSPKQLPDDAFFRAHFRLVHERPESLLYELQ